MSANDKVVEVIVGPTASGKSSLGLQMAREDSNIEIVNADASLLYKRFDIGTAKPSQTERRETPHHLIDILNPEEHFSAARFSLVARDVIRDVFSRGKRPLVVGGTGFYIDALFVGIVENNIDEETAQASHNKYLQEFEAFGFLEMHKKLEAIDPELYLQIDREQNPRRLQRAWEFYYSTGTPLGQARQQQPDAFEYVPKYHLITVDREILHTKIIKRVDEMLMRGWLSEVTQLLENGVTIDMPAMKSIGYKTLAEVVRGTKTIEIAREEIIIATRQYAKRQVTWMKKYG